jgi:hypothetical protein
VSPTGGRRWAFRYQRNGIVKNMGFGSAKQTGLKLSEAKDKAIDALRLLAKGIDPKDFREEEKRRARRREFAETCRFCSRSWRIDGDYDGTTMETGVSIARDQISTPALDLTICLPDTRNLTGWPKACGLPRWKDLLRQSYEASIGCRDDRQDRR